MQLFRQLLYSVNMSKPVQQGGNPPTRGSASQSSGTDNVGGNGNSKKTDTHETWQKEMIDKRLKIDCNQGMRVLKISKYPTNTRQKVSGPFFSQIIVREVDNKHFRMGAIIVDDAAVKVKNKMKNWGLKDVSDGYRNALLLALKNSTSKIQHNFDADLQSPKDFVLAVIAAPNDDGTPNGVPVGRAADKDTLKYNILVRRTKYHPPGEVTPELKEFRDWLKTHDSISVNRFENLIAKSESQPTSNENKGSTSNKYVPLGGNDDSQKPIQPSAPHLDNFESDSINRPLRRLKRSETGQLVGQPTTSNSFTLASNSALHIGSICAISAGISYLLVKKSKRAA